MFLRQLSTTRLQWTAAFLKRASCQVASRRTPAKENGAPMAGTLCRVLIIPKIFRRDFHCQTDWEWLRNSELSQQTAPITFFFLLNVMFILNGYNILQGTWCGRRWRRGMRSTTKSYLGFWPRRPSHGHLIPGAKAVGCRMTSCVLHTSILCCVFVWETTSRFPLQHSCSGPIARSQRARGKLI